MLSRLARAAYPYGRVRRVLRGPARGARFTVAPGIAVSFALGTDAAAPRHFARWIRPGMAVYDVGANKGQMTLVFASLVGPSGRVVAFEPAPDEFGQLVRNVGLNQFGWVRTMAAAAAESAGTMVFTYSADLPSQGKLRDVEVTYEIPGAKSFTVPTVSLDDVAREERPPDVLKIDVEGGAAAVLRGARRLLDEIRPRIYIELHGPEEQSGLRDELQLRGYRLLTMDGRTVTDPVAEWHSPLWCHPPDGPPDSRE